MADLEIYKINNFQLQIICDDGLAHKIANYFSVLDKNRFFNPAYKRRAWDGKIFFFNKKTRILSIGFFKELLLFCDKNNISYQLQFKIDELFTDISKEQLNLFYKTLFKDPDFFPKDHQQNAVYLALKNKMGIIESCTGSGKSLMLFIIIRYLLLMNKQILLIVPSTTLVEQSFSDWKEYGWVDCENYVNLLYSGKTLDENKPILISTYQSLINKDKSFFKKFGVLLVDECLHPETKIKVKEKIYNSELKKYFIHYIDKKIKDIKIGDLVQSYNFETKRKCYKPVEKIFKNLNKKNDIYLVTLENGEKFIVSGNHPVYLKNGKKKRVDQLTMNDEV